MEHNKRNECCSHCYLGLLIGKALVAVLLTTSGIAFAASEIPAPSGRIGVKHMNADASQAEQNSGYQARGTETAPIFIRSIASPESESDAAHKQWEHHEKPSLDRRLTISTELLAAFTFVLMVFTGLMWLATYKLSRDAKLAGAAQERKMQDSIAEAARSTAAMERVATATVNNANLMQSIMHKQLRAYIVHSNVQATYARDLSRNAADGFFFFDIIMENSGLTPAINFVAEAIQFCGTDPITKPVDAEFEQASSNSILGPKCTVATRIVIPISDIVRVYNKVADLSIHFRCAYQDFVSESGEVRRSRGYIAIGVLADPLHAIEQDPIPNIFTIAPSYSHYS